MPRVRDLALSHAHGCKITNALFQYLFLDDRSFAVRESSTKVKHRFPHRRRCIERLLMQVQIDVLCLKLHQGSNKVLEASPQAID
jgi:hypothetical protein